MTPPWAGLARAIDGDVLLHGSPDHERLAPAFNARFDDVRPEAIVACTTPEDVAETIRFLGRHGLAHAIRSGGTASPVTRPPAACSSTSAACGRWRSPRARCGWAPAPRSAASTNSSTGTA